MNDIRDHITFLTIPFQRIDRTLIERLDSQNQQGITEKRKRNKNTIYGKLYFTNESFLEGQVSPGLSVTAVRTGGVHMNQRIESGLRKRQRSAQKTDLPTTANQVIHFANKASVHIGVTGYVKD